MYVFLIDTIYLLTQTFLKLLLVNFYLGFSFYSRNSLLVQTNITFKKHNF
jgi:hypothetical protein